MASDKIQVLFVDDEIKILNGLKRLLHPMKKEWNMEFANGGVEALKMMENKRFQVIVTDMRMPGMDGNELLGIVRNQYPEIVRIVLSGHSEKEAVLKAAGRSHVFLSKPCSPSKLKSVIKKATSLRKILYDPYIMSVVANMKNVPSLPSIYQELLEVIEAPNSTMKDISKVISKDMGMTVKLLQLVNSAYFGLNTEITNLTKAMNYLGIDIIMSLVLTFKVFSEFNTREFPDMDVERFWQHCLNTALIAKELASMEKQEGKDQDDAFIGGLLHDLGKTVMMANFPPKYNQVLNKFRDGANLSDTELALLGANHEQVGAYLVSLWGLPDIVAEGIALHHETDTVVMVYGSPMFVYMANKIERLVWEKNEKEYREKLSEEFLRMMKVKTDSQFIWDKAKLIVHGS